jgi:hypothetical protein
MNAPINIEKINCPCFIRKYNQILDNKHKVNRSARSIEKAIYAEDFEEGINELLECETYDPLNMDCLNCRIAAKLQKKSAEGMLHLKATA